MRRALALVMAAAMAASAWGCSPRKADPTQTAIEKVAHVFDTLPTTGKFTAPALPDQPEPKPMGDFVVSIDSTLMWNDYVVSLGGKLSARSTAFLWDKDDEKSTTCDRRNYDAKGPSKTVTPESEPFFCPTDGSGTLYLPMNSIRTTWLNAHQPYATAAQAVLVWLSAQWGDAYMIDIYNLATNLHVADFPDVRKVMTDQYLSGLTFGYCIAGAFAKSLGLDHDTALNAMRILLGDDGGMPRVKFREALEIGLNTGRPGECIRKLWPGHS